MWGILSQKALAELIQLSASTEQRAMAALASIKVSFRQCANHSQNIDFANQKGMAHFHWSANPSTPQRTTPTLM